MWALAVATSKINQKRTMYTQSQRVGSFLCQCDTILIQSVSEVKQNVSALVCSSVVSPIVMFHPKSDSLLLILYQVHSVSIIRILRSS